MATKTTTTTAKRRNVTTKKGKEMENALTVQANNAPALFEYQAITPGSFFDLSTITDETLKADTIELESIVYNAKESGEKLSKSAAMVVGKIYKSKSYVRSNFKSLEAYGKTIGLINETTSKAAVYQLAFAGCIYNDETLPDAMRRLPVAHLSVIKSAYENKKHPEYKEQIIADAPNTFDGITVKEMRQYVERLTAKPVVIDTYVRFAFPIKPGDIESAITTNAKRMEEIDDEYKDNKECEWLTVKAIKTTFGDTKIEFPRRVLVTPNDYTMYVFVPKSHIEQRQKTSPVNREQANAYNAIRIGAFIDGKVTSLLTEKDIKDFIQNPDTQGLTEARIAFINENYPGLLDDGNDDDYISYDENDNETNE